MRLPAQDIGDLVDVFRMLGDDARVRILLLLAAHREMTVSHLCAELGKRQPLVSHHLGLLRKGSLVSARRDGRYVYYSLAGAADGGGDANRDGLCLTRPAGLCVRIS